MECEIFRPWHRHFLLAAVMLDMQYNIFILIYKYRFSNKEPNSYCIAFEAFYGEVNMLLAMGKICHQASKFNK